MHTPAAPACLLLLLFSLTACSESERPRTTASHTASDYSPLEEGRTWTYRVRRGDREIKLALRKYHGDVRTRDGEKVRFHFLYGKPGSASDERSKSIYALPKTGIEEFYIDCYIASLYHQPPVPLLKEVRVGASWAWTGTLEINHEVLETSVEMTVAARETLDLPAGRFECLRLEERAKEGEVLITRWLAPGVGMVKLLVRGLGQEYSLDLLAHAGPPVVPPTD